MWYISVYFLRISAIFVTLLCISKVNFWHWYCYFYLDFSPEVAGCWPLDSVKQSALTANNERLIELLDTDEDLIAEMWPTDCFTEQQLISIRNTEELSDRNRKLLSLLSRRSVDHLNQLAVCLNKTQPHIVPLLTPDSGT